MGKKKWNGIHTCFRLKNMGIGIKAKQRYKACTEENKLVDKEGKKKKIEVSAVQIV